MEWNHFCYVYRSIIQRANRNQLKIVLLGGATLYFKAETEGQRAVRGFHANICSIDDSLGRWKKIVKWIILKIRCWIVQIMMPKELRVYFQQFLVEKIEELEQELRDIACGKESEV